MATLFFEVSVSCKFSPWFWPDPTFIHASWSVDFVGAQLCLCRLSLATRCCFLPLLYRCWVAEGEQLVNMVFSSAKWRLFSWMQRLTGIILFGGLVDWWFRQVTRFTTFLGANQWWGLLSIQGLSWHNSSPKTLRIQPNLADIYNLGSSIHLQPLPQYFFQYPLYHFDSFEVLLFHHQLGILWFLVCLSTSLIRFDGAVPWLLFFSAGG